MKKSTVNWLSGVLTAAVFLFVWLKLINWNEFLHYFKEFNLKYALLFSIFYILAYFSRSIRWKIILNPLVKLKISKSFYIYMVGMFVNYIIPVRAGEVAKSFILKKTKNISVAESLPTVFIDKISDLFPIIMILILIPLVSVKLNATLFIIIGLIFFIFIFFLLFLYLSAKHQSSANKFLGFIIMFVPARFKERTENFLSSFITGMAIMKGRKTDTSKVYILTILAVLSEALYILMIFRAFGSEISYTKILFGYTLMNLTYILPTPPAQIGSNQFMWVLIFSFALGEDANLTSAAVTFSHLLTSIWIFGVSAISFLALKLNFSEVVHSKN